MNALNIVTVDSSETGSVLLEQLLNELGYELGHHFPNGESLLEAAQKTDIDILFMNVDLAGKLNGIQTIRRFKKMFPATPFFYLIHDPDAYTLKQTDATMPWGYLQKPFNRSLLGNILDMTRSNKQAMYNLFEKSASVQTLIENQELKKEVEMLKIYNQELTVTNEHLITATWRERDLKKELQQSKELIENQNRKIRESIQYAKRIQKAIIPKEHHLRKHFHDFSMLYIPRDVVSGDFPYLYEKGPYIYLAAIDCTGHGVPGAMMSLIGYLLQNNILNGPEALTPGEAIAQLHESVVKTLNQTADIKSSADGMDLAMLRIHTKTKEVLFSGAHRPLLIQSANGTIKEVRGSMYPVGGMQHKNEHEFKNHRIAISEGDRLFIYTDGLQDQFCTDGKKKFSKKRITDILEANGDNSLETIKDALHDAFIDWKGDYMQIDDVLLMGVEI